MKFLAIYYYRLRVLFSDRLFIVAFVIIPLTLSLITGYAQRKEKLGYVPLVVVDEDHTPDSELLCKRFAQKEGLKITISDREEALKILGRDDAEVMVVIEKGFAKSLEQGNLEEVITMIKSPNTYSAEMVKEIVSIEALRIYSGYFTYQWLADSYKSSGLDPSELNKEDIKEKVEAYWRPKPLMTISYEELKVTPQSGKTVSVPSFTAASLGLLVLFIMMGLLFGSSWLCEEKANGTLQRVLSIERTALPLFSGNVAALATMGMLLTFIFEGVQRVLFHTSLLQGAYSWLVMAAYIFCAASLSMLLASLFETPHQLQAVTPVFALITGLIGGCLWNLLGVPSQLLKMALLTPQGWALQALTSLYAAPDQLQLALPAILILAGIAVAFFSIAFRRFLKVGGL